MAPNAGIGKEEKLFDVGSNMLAIDDYGQGDRKQIKGINIREDKELLAG